MRSRYSAYVLGNMDYIVRTTLPEQQQSLDAEDIADSMRDISWLRLEVVRTEQGRASDETGIVEFRATASVSGQEHVQAERSRFQKRDGIWYYDHSPSRARPGESKAGRNDPCPCGSGKKWKRCCG